MILCIFWGASCSSRVASTSLPFTLAAPQLAPGESARLPLDSGGGPTVESPHLQLNVEVTDKQTGRRVDDARVSLDGQVLGRGCCLVVVIEASTPHTLTVTADGYAPWEVMLNPHIRHNTVMTAPVELEPIKPEARLPRLIFVKLTRDSRITED
ncbi:MAG: hypothetical protein JW850_02595 [Thermoflexales bacterium]|nr:hypothetical protein [Thermoflexales bacterium]